MSDLRKAAQEAAKVLANALSIDFNDKRDWYSYKHDVEYAANLLRQAIAQDEPWDTSDMAHRAGGLTVEQSIAQPEQEPVCTKIEGNQFDTFKVRYEDAVKLKDLPVGTKLYTAPPSKPFVFLTKEDMPSGDHPMYDTKEFYAGMAWAQTKLKEKNGG